MQHYQECVALGSKTGLSLVSNATPPRIGKLYRKLWREIFLFERQFSRFLPGSELSMFNRGAGIQQPITPEFRDILLAARDIANTTGGLYNPFILPAVQAAGYTYSRVPGREHDTVDDYADRAFTTMDRLEIGNDWARIPYGTAIDLGGCGKGYIADKLQRELPDFVTGYWLSFGGDMAIGGRDENDKPWTVTIETIADIEDVEALTVKIPCGVATSGTTVHQGEQSGKVWHHLIDPRTRQPAQTDVLLATVCDRSALRADVLASCAVILGSRKGLQFLQDQGVEYAVLQCRNTKNVVRSLKTGNAIIGDSNISEAIHA